ncbi:unnamed protein product [Rhizoctonia solani]|uniref:Uncharacterized protein n=1 Tax=Rhizoctonia solani TaxID=456999 RepID=A0A8H3CW20_9AGAM|nr:unnamed protein product [Rhizoctonia solani]
MSDFPYMPFPFNVTLSSPLFDLSPVTSNVSQGWAPSCALPECMPTASWSTGSIGASLSFQFWGGDVAFDGNVTGNMSVEVFRDGVREIWNPSADTLFRSRGQATDDLYLHNIALRVLDSSLGSELTIKQAQVNGSSLIDRGDSDRWTIPSNDDRISYTGFVQQASAAPGSQTTYISSKPGATVSMEFNASTLLIYGPCGPTNGLMRVTINGRESTVNTSTPIPSIDCLLFQSWALTGTIMNQLLVENVNGASLGINRLHFWWGTLDYNRRDSSTTAKTVVIVLGSVLAVGLTWAGWVIFSRKSELGKKVKKNLKSLFL